MHCGIIFSMPSCLVLHLVMLTVSYAYQAILPSVVTPIDGAQLVQMSVKSHKTAVLLADTIVTTQEFINKCAAPFEQLMNQKAKKVGLCLFRVIFKNS